MKTTINKLRTELQLLAEANEMLNGFYWKDLLRAQSESVCQYPLMTVHYTIGGIVKNQTRVTLEINICDKIGRDWNENLNDVESDTLNIQRQIFNAMQSVRWKKLGRIESASVRKFIADSADYVAGHTMTLTFLLRDTDGVCDLPIFNYDFDSIQTDENTVTVFNTDSSYSVVVDCGDSLELPDITYEIKNSLDDVISSATVPSVNNISDVLPDVVNTDSDGTPVATPAGVAFVCTPNPPCANGTINVNKSDGALISAVPVASGGVAPYNVADSVITLNDSASTLISTTNVKATDPAIITAPNGTATNTDASTVIQVKSNGNSTIPNSFVNVNGVNEGNVVSAKTIEIVTTQAGAPYAPTTITVLANTITMDFPAGGATYDADAQAFIDAVAILDSSQEEAINNLVLRLKSAGIWTKLYAFYPCIGGTAASHKWNLKNPLDTDAAFRLVFNGGFTHDASGITGNAVNAYAQTFFVPATHGLLDDMGISISSLSNTNSSTQIDMGCGDTSASNLLLLNTRSGGSLRTAINQDTAATIANNNSYGYHSANRTGATSGIRIKIGQDSLLFSGSATASTARSSYELYISALNVAGTAQDFSARILNCIAIHTGLTNMEAVQIKTISNVFNIALSRGL